MDEVIVNVKQIKYKDMDNLKSDLKILFEKYNIEIKTLKIISKESIKKHNILNKEKKSKAQREFKAVGLSKNGMILIRYSDGYEESVKLSSYTNNTVVHPLDIIIANHGYIGIGDYNKSHVSFNVWCGMLSRCYIVEKNKDKKLTVCSEWHNFQTFAKWYEDNYYEIKDERIDLDKDILLKENKTYSPNSCCFIPMSINTMMTPLRTVNSGIAKGARGTYHSVNMVNGKKITHVGFLSIEDARANHIRIKRDCILSKLYNIRDYISIEFYNRIYASIAVYTF